MKIVQSITLGFILWITWSDVSQSDDKSDATLKWDVSATAVFKGDSGSRVISATAKSQPATFVVSKSEASGKDTLSGKISLDTGSISMESLRDKIFEKAVQKALKTVSLELNEFSNEATEAKDEKTILAKIPLKLLVNETNQPAIAKVTQWKVGEAGKILGKAKLKLSLEKTELKVPSVIKLDDTIDVEIDLVVTPKSESL